MSKGIDTVVLICSVKSFALFAGTVNSSESISISLNVKGFDVAEDVTHWLAVAGSRYLAQYKLVIRYKSSIAHLRIVDSCPIISS